MNYQSTASGFLKAAQSNIELAEGYLNGLVQGNTILSQANENLAARAKAHKEENDIIKTDREVLRQKLAGKADECESLRNRVAELESVTAGYAQTIDVLRTTKCNALCALGDEQEQRRRAEEAVEELKKDIQERNRNLTDSRIELADLSRSKEEAISYWKQRSKDMEENWHLTIAACDKIKQRIRGLELENYILKTNLQNAMNTVRDLQTAIEAKELALAAAQAAHKEDLGQLFKLAEKYPNPGSFLAGAVKQSEET
jgi:chromosome segregation ATPase